METNFFKAPNLLELSPEALKRYGRHVSRPKAIALLCVTSLACLCPTLLALRFWDNVPMIIETGLIGENGQDDSLPRWALFFAIPGLFFLLNLICHGQFWLNQQRSTIPSRPVRLFGRWFFPVVSVLVSSFWILRAAQAPITPADFAPLPLGLALLPLGASLFDTDKNALVVSLLCFAVGLCSIVGGMLCAQFIRYATPMITVAALLAAIYIRKQEKEKSEDTL